MIFFISLLSEVKIHRMIFLGGVFIQAFMLGVAVGGKVEYSWKQIGGANEIKITLLFGLKSETRSHLPSICSCTNCISLFMAE